MSRTMLLLKKIVPGILQFVVVGAILATALVAYEFGSRRGDASRPAMVKESPAPSPAHPVDANGDGTIYTCSMHPQILQDESGKCPICAMDLVPVDVRSVPEPARGGHATHSDGTEGEPVGYACSMNCVPPLEEPGKCPVCGMEMQPVHGDPAHQRPAEGDPARRLVLTDEARALASIRTSEVVRMVPRRSVRLVGQLAVDPSRRAHISADVGGRIDRLAARYEGDVVEKGEDLVLLYSPELLAVQNDFIQATTTLERLSDGALESVREGSRGAVAAARERLRLAGMSDDQIESVASSRAAKEQFTLRAPVGGTVVTRHAEEGEYVAKGARILTVADLGKLWVEMAAYESDLAWLHAGQPVVFASEAFPGESFAGSLAWIDPTTDMRTRTTRVRLDVDNERGLLRPGMYVRATVEATLGDAPVLVVPAAAPLLTGRRAVVYVESTESGRPAYQGVEVVLGSRSDEGYVVEEGLSEGQRVVTEGAFRIDSALQIVAKPSMMNPQGGSATTGHEGHAMASPSQGDEPAMHAAPDPPRHEGRDDGTDRLLTAYLHVQRALANDDFDHARHAWRDVAKAVDGHEEFAMAVQKGRRAESIDAMRAAFKELGDVAIRLLREGRIHPAVSLRLVHCPMAFASKGADWLQTEPDVRNPYYGAAMLSCGAVTQEWPGHD